MKKKIALMCIVLAMTAGSFSALAYDDVVMNYDVTSVALVDGLGIMEGTDQNTFGSESFMTRGQFAVAVAKMLKLEVTEGKMGNSAFSDVDISTAEGCAVNILADTGIIPVNESKYNPSEIITYAEAARELINSLGYGYEVDLNGGYPGGVIKVAANLRLSAGLKMTTNTQITKKDAAVLIYNALMTETMDMKIENGTPIYEKSEETLLENRWDVYDTTGIIGGVGDASLDGVSLDENQVSVGGEVMQCAIPNIKDYIGYNVKAYYISDNDGDTTLVAVVPKSNENIVKTIDADDLIVSGDNVRYEEDNKTRTQNVANGAQVLYNGRLYTDYNTLADIIDISEGSVTFISNDGSKKANVIIVNDEKHILVERVDKKNTTIYAANSTEENANPYLASALKLDYDLQNITITLDGAPASFDDIQVNDVLVVKESKDEGMAETEDIEISIERNIIEGSVGTVSKTDREITVSGTDYKLSAYCKDMMNAGDNGSYAATKSGKIVGIVATKTSSLKYAYIKEISKVDSNYQEIYVDLFTQDGEQRRFTINDKVNINGKRVKYNEVPKFISEGEFVSFKLKSDGTIATLNRPYDASANPDYYSETSFIKNWSKSSVRYIGGIMGRSIITEDTTIFYIPRYDRDLDSDYRIMSVEDLSNRIYADVACYDVDRNGRVGALVIKEDIKETVSKGNSLFVVDKVLQGVDEDDDPVVKVEGFEKGEPKTLTFCKDTDSVTYEDGWMNYTGNENFDLGYNSDLPGRDLSAGDMLQYALNPDGNVGAYRLVYNNYDAIYTAGDLTYDDPKYYYERWSKTGAVTKLDFTDDLYIGLGKMEMRYNDFAVLCALNEEERSKYSNSKVNMIDYYRPVKLNQEETYVYTYNVDSEKVEVGTMEDIAKNDTAFVRSKAMGTLNEIMVYVED